MRHQKNSERDGIFILVNNGVPNTNITEYGEQITNSSLCLDSTNQELYILKNNVWVKYGTGFSPTAYIPLAGTIFNKPVTGNIEYHPGVANYSGNARLTYYSDIITIDSTNNRLYIADNIIYSTKNNFVLDNNSKNNFVTSLFSDNITISNSSNNKLFMSFKDGVFDILNSNDNIISGSFDGGSLIFDNNTRTDFKGIYNGVSDIFSVSYNTATSISLIVESGTNSTVSHNIGSYIYGSISDSTIELLNNSYIYGYVDNSTISESSTLRFFSDISDSSITNSSNDNFSGSKIINVEMSNITDNFFGVSILNESDFNSVENSVFLGKITSISASTLDTNTIINSSNYMLMTSSYNHISTSTGVVDQSYIRGEYNFFHGISDISLTGFTAYNIVFFTNNIKFRNGYTENNIILSNGFDGTVGSNNFLIHTNTSNNIFGDYNLFFGDIIIPSDIDLKNKNIVLGNHTLNDTISSSNILLGAKNLSSINHNSQNENVIINVDNFLVDDSQTVYLPNKINLVNNSFKAKIDAVNITQNNTYLLPNNSGTLALLSDISSAALIATNGITITGNNIELGGVLNKNTTISGNQKQLSLGDFGSGNNLSELSIKATNTTILSFSNYDGTGTGTFMNFNPSSVGITNAYTPGKDTSLNISPTVASLLHSNTKIINLTLYNIVQAGETFTINGVTFTEGVDFFSTGDVFMDADTIASINYSSVPNFVSVSYLGAVVNFTFSAISTYSTTFSNAYFSYAWTSSVKATENSTYLSVGYSNSPTSLEMTDSITIFTDTSTNGAGIQYADDYSATYTDRSLVDKEYADNATDVLGTFLTDYVTSPTNTQLSSSNTVLNAFESLQKQINDIPVITGLSYTTIRDLALTNSLKEGCFYELTFASKDIIEGTNDISYTGYTETLLMLAINNNMFAPQVYSKMYPNDIIYFDFFNNKYTSRDGSIEYDRTGYIYYRKDLIRNIEVDGYDYRNHIIRRYLVDKTVLTSTNGWAGLTLYTVDDFVFITDKVYRCSTAHTSTTVFADDLKTYWTLVLDLTYSFILTSPNTEIWFGSLNLTPDILNFKDGFAIQQSMSLNSGFPITTDYTISISDINNNYYTSNYNISIKSFKEYPIASPFSPLGNIYLYTEKYYSSTKPNIVIWSSPNFGNASFGDDCYNITIYNSSGKDNVFKNTQDFVIVDNLNMTKNEFYDISSSQLYNNKNFINNNINYMLCSCVARLNTVNNNRFYDINTVGLISPSGSITDTFNSNDIVSVKHISVYGKCDGNKIDNSSKITLTNSSSNEFNDCVTLTLTDSNSNEFDSSSFITTDTSNYNIINNSTGVIIGGSVFGGSDRNDIDNSETIELTNSDLNKIIKSTNIFLVDSDSNEFDNSIYITLLSDSDKNGFDNSSNIDLANSDSNEFIGSGYISLTDSNSNEFGNSTYVLLQTSNYNTINNSTGVIYSGITLTNSNSNDINNSETIELTNSDSNDIDTCGLLGAITLTDSDRNILNNSDSNILRSTTNTRLYTTSACDIIATNSMFTHSSNITTTGSLNISDTVFMDCNTMTFNSSAHSCNFTGVGNMTFTLSAGTLSSVIFTVFYGGTHTITNPSINGKTFSIIYGTSTYGVATNNGSSVHLVDLISFH